MQAPETPQTVSVTPPEDRHFTPQRGPVSSGTGLILLAALFWSTNGVCIKELSGFSPLAASAGRALFGGLLFFIVSKGRLLPERGSGPWPWLGAVCYALVVSTFVVATRYTTAANAIILQNTSVIWVALLGSVVVRERPSGQEMVAIVLGLLGIVLCMGHGLELLATKGSVSLGLLGDAIALVSGVGFALTTLSLRSLSRGESDQGAVVSLFYGSLLAGLAGLPWLIRDFGSAGIPGRAPVYGWLLLAWLGMGQLGMGYWLYQRGLRSTRALTANLLALLEPVLNPIWVFLTVGEVPSAGTIAGGGLVLVSVVMTLTSCRTASAR